MKKIIWREIEKINNPTRTGACCTIIMICLGSNYTPHLPWAHVSHVNSSCISYRRRYSTRSPIILDLSTFLRDKAPTLVHRVSFNSTRVGRSLLTHNLATFVLIPGLIVPSCALFFT